MHRISVILTCMLVFASCDSKKLQREELNRTDNEVVKSNVDIDARLVGRWEGTTLFEGEHANGRTIDSSWSVDLNSDASFVIKVSGPGYPRGELIKGTWSGSIDKGSILFMPNSSGNELMAIFKALLEACVFLGITKMVIPRCGTSTAVVRDTLKSMFK